MAMELSVEAKEMALNGVLGGDSPFLEASDGLRLRHDAIRMTLTDSGMLVELLWRDKPIGNMPVVMVAPGDSVTVQGIEGSQKVQIT